MSRVKDLERENKQLREEVEYLLRWLGGFNRELSGLSADALSEVAFRGGEPKEYPRDFGDLARCEKAFDRLPSHLRERVRPILEGWRAGLVVR